MASNPTVAETPHLGSISEELALFNIHPSKSFGQNFLLDMNLTDKIARIAQVEKRENIVEIGPGPGGLTRSLLKTGAKVTSIEMDNALYPLLERISKAYPDQFKLIKGDALNIDLNKEMNAYENFKIVANLPYNVATPLLIQWLSHPWPPKFTLLTLMFQQEVALRITAQPSSKQYGRLSILSQWLCDVEIALHLPPSAFFPPPKVNSSVVVFRPKTSIFDVDLKSVEIVTQAIFHQRRKKIRSGLKTIFSAPDEVLNAIDIDPNVRGETLPVLNFLQIAKYYSEMKADHAS